MCRFWSMKALTSTTTTEAGTAPLHPVKGSVSDTGKLVRTVLHSLEDAKAEDLVSIDLQGKTSLADVMIVASGRSNVHVGAIAERIIKACKENALPTPKVEGLPHCDWVLVDVGDVIVHIFRPEVRAFYNLEKMWGGDRPGERSAQGVRAAG
jgi:ribosome-associated protein